MADMWVGGPEANDPALLTAGRARVQAHARILIPGDESACRLCGSREGIAQTADTYGHVQPDRHEAAVDRLDQYLK